MSSALKRALERVNKKLTVSQSGAILIVSPYGAEKLGYNFISHIKEPQIAEAG